jgi:GMP synthase (glutamine-hydrolysing)
MTVSATGPTTDPVLVIEHESGAGLSLIEAALPIRTRVIRPYLGDPIPAADDQHGLAEHCGLIVLGGEMGAWDDDVAAWLPATRRLIADAVRGQVPMLGICLGAQLLAAACGGTVETGPAPEIGLKSVTPLPAAAQDSFFAAIDESLGPVGRPADEHDASPVRAWPVHQYHYDAVTKLPADGELLVTGETYQIQGFRVGPAAWGVQYHPEVSTHEFLMWVANGQRSGALTEDDATAVLEPIRAGGEVQARLAAAHADAFLTVVRSSALYPS